DRFYSHAIKKPLEPEVLADAISDVLSVPDQYGKQPRGTRAVALFDPRIESQALDILGRCSREDTCESTAAPAGGLPQKLHLFNGPLINSRLSEDSGRLGRLMADGHSPEEIVEAFYLTALSRRPSAGERAFWNDQFANLDADPQV